jgi:xylulokinase
MDPKARACLVGLTKYHTRNHIIRAVMEGVVYALKQGLDLMLNLGVPVDSVVVSGGASQHPLWVQLQSDIYNRPVYRSKTREAAAFGAAVLAGVGVGYFKNVKQAVSNTVHWDEKAVYPLVDNAEMYAEGYRIYSAIYPFSKEINHALSGRGVGR